MGNVRKKIILAGIVIDNWKAESFKKQLIDAGYDIESEKPFSKDSTIFQVKCLNIAAEMLKLEQTIKTAELNAKRSN